MKRGALIFAANAFLALAVWAPAAQAEFGLSEFEVSFSGPEGEIVTQAGSHPFAMRTSFHFDSVAENVEEVAKDLFRTQLAGFVVTRRWCRVCRG